MSQGCPAARSLHTAVWTGSQMIVWGGARSTSDVLGKGGVYIRGPAGAAPRGSGAVGMAATAAVVLDAVADHETPCAL
jgi:hypothetical protein